jgi:anti-sigma regulatory factor (Ser/Thr protein kinase)
MTVLQERLAADQDEVTAVGHALPHSPLSPSLARAIVREKLAGVCPSTVETAQALASELVTNAVVHAGSMLVLRVMLAGDRWWIAVEDLSADSPLPQQPPPDADAGRGLMFLSALASAWGWDRTSTGKQVWFELPACS